MEKISNILDTLEKSEQKDRNELEQIVVEPLSFLKKTKSGKRITTLNMECGGKTYLCVVGRNGISSDKQEGDGATPAGQFSFRRLWYREDRISDLTCALPKSVIKKDDGWCDDPSSPSYNIHVKLPFKGSHERLWLEDNVYDIFVEIGYNYEPIKPGKGSAIFMHVASPDFSPTAGCVALALKDLKEILKAIDLDTQISIKSSGISIFQAPNLKVKRQVK